MFEVRGKIKKWGNSAAIRLAKKDLRRFKLRLDQDVKVMIMPKTDVISETFGMFKGLRKKSGQRMKDEIRKELHGM